MPPTAHDVHLQTADANPSVPVKVRHVDGWSPSIEDSCIVARAWHDTGDGTAEAVSEVVEMGYPQDCIAVSEPTVTMMFAVGVLLLAGLRVGTTRL